MLELLNYKNHQKLCILGTSLQVNTIAKEIDCYLRIELSIYWNISITNRVFSEKYHFNSFSQ